jgi:NLI interacting factor-like phosphatase
VKPLHLIWSKHPRWGKNNTLIVDDLERNFVLNPESGVLIKAFYRNPDETKRSHKPRSSSSSATASAPLIPFLPLGTYSSSQTPPAVSSPSPTASSSSSSSLNTSTEQGVREGEDPPKDQDQELLHLSRCGLVQLVHLHQACLSPILSAGLPAYLSLQPIPLKP